MNPFSIDTFGGDLNDFGRPFSTGQMCLLSYPPENLFPKLNFPVAKYDAKHQDEFDGPVRAIGKVRGEFATSTTHTNEQDVTVLKE